jgi:hypothetical protein
MNTHPHPPTHRLYRLLTFVLFGLVLVAGPALGTGSAAADPTPPATSGFLTVPSPIGPSPTSAPSGRTSRSPAPTPTPTPVPSPPGGTSGGVSVSVGGPAWFDIPGQIRKAINDFFVWVARTGLKPVLDTLGSTVLSTPDLTGNDKVRAFWTTSLLTANAVFVLFIVLAGFVVMSRETLQTQYGVKDMLPRLALGGIAANLSLLACGKVLWAANALTAAIAGQGVDGPAAAAALRQTVDSARYGTNFLLALLVLALLVMALVVVIMFILRVAAIVLLVGIAPLALICHSTPQTEGLARLWWRALGACVGIQLAQAVIFLATLKVFLTPAGRIVLGMPATGSGLLGLLVCLTMLWVLIKLPGWTRQFVLGPLGQRRGRGLLGQLAYTYLTVRTLSAAAGLTRRSGKAGRTPGTPGAGTGTAPYPNGPRPSPYRPGPPRPSRPDPPRPSRPGPARPSPAPAGPVTFSHTPAVQTPLGRPDGTNAAPTFSQQPTPANPTAAPPRGVPPARFSHPSPPQPTSTVSPTPTAPANPAVFSSAAAHTPRPTPGGPAPAVTFTSASSAQAAPQWPAAPVVPVFSAQPRAPQRIGTAGTASSGRPAAQRRPTVSRPTPTAGDTPPVVARRTPASAPVPSPPPVESPVESSQRRPRRSEK